MTHKALRFLWMLFIGWWASIIWFFVGYLLVALVVTKQAGFWVFQRLGVVYCLLEPMEEEIIFPKKILTYIWFYIGGWVAGPLVMLIDIILSILCCWEFKNFEGDIVDHVILVLFLE